MSFCHIHFLNARHALTPIRLEIRQAANHAMALVRDHIDLPDFDMIIRGQPNGGVPEWGVGGHAHEPGVIEITLNPDRFDPVLFTRTFVHELHHLLRWDGPGYGKSLGSALVSEGLAGHFVLQVLGGKPDPWDTTRPSSGVARRAMNEWSRLGYDHSEWFFGKGKLRKWTGYGLGHLLVAEHLSHQPQEDAVTLVRAAADTFREAMRKLAKADGGDEPVAEEQDPHADTAPKESSAPKV